MKSLMRKMYFCLLILFLLSSCGGGSVDSVQISEIIFLPAGYEDDSKYSGRYMQIQNTDIYFRETLEYALVRYYVAGSLDELRLWFYETYEREIPYWAIAFAVKYTDGSVEFWLTGKKTVAQEGVQFFIHPAMFFEQWMILLNSEDQRIRHPYDWFGKPPEFMG